MRNCAPACRVARLTVIFFCTLFIVACGDDGEPSGTGTTGPGTDVTDGSGNTDDDTDTMGGSDDDVDTGDRPRPPGDDIVDPFNDPNRLATGEECLLDDECRGQVCFQFDPNVEEGFCTQYCGANGDCPDDTFRCVFLQNTGGDFARICVPSDLCIDRDGDGYGVGPGCLGPDCDDNDPNVYLGAPEICDGIDNNCNGNIDENPIGANESCSTGFPGVCAPGRNRCQNGILVCSPEREPQQEICDGVDNDCDGRIDNDGDEPLSQVCYNGPAGTDGVGECRAGVRTCIDGSITDCIGQVLPFPEVCDGLDNNCNGLIDEGLPGAGQPCDVTDAVGVCQRGRTQCTEEGDLICAPQAFATDEICDGLDNNCNGFIDEGLDGEPLQRVCYDGPEGTLDVGVCTSGIQTCLEAEYGPCVGQVRPSPEICDGLDNNCNGNVDEGEAGGGFLCSTGLLGACAVGTTFCTDDGTECRANFEPEPEICDRIDNNCNGFVDEGPDGGPLTQPCYSGREGTLDVGLCRGGTQTCVGDGYGVCLGQITPEPELCDNQDNDCDGFIDEGNPGGGVPCSTGLPGICASGVTACSDGSIVCDANNEATTEVCDGLDNNCNGVIDEAPGGGPITRACYTGPAGTQDIGVCMGGVQTCSGGDFGVCAGEIRPSAEVCDGLDNNCNGNIDEGNPGGGVACASGLAGVCAAGTTICDDGATRCVANLAPSAEICDGLDNNCNGVIDEAPGGGPLSRSCYGGPPGTLGEGLCTEGVQTCAGGDFGVCVGEVRPSPEVCDGNDNNCNGNVDEGNPGGGIVCNTGGQGVCGAGITVCVDGETMCNQTATASAEICDGLDNNCNGFIDEAPGGGALTRECYDGPAGTQGFGVCTAGVQTCAGGEFRSCVGQTLPSAEICDGLDNNCNGNVDEGNPGGGIACITSNPGVCSAGSTACVEGAVACVGTIQPGDLAEICDGLDNNCNGTIDEGFPGLGTPCFEGLGLCRRAGVVVCNVSDRSAPPVCDAVPGTPVAEVCDFQDNNCNGNVDEAFRNAAGIYNQVSHCGSCNIDCNNRWPGGPALFNVIPNCGVAGGTASCGFTCMPGFVDADGVGDNGCELQPEPDTIYVATPNNGGTNSGTCGAWDNPCATIGHALTRASSTSAARLRVSTGVFRENVVVSNGVSILGGHNAINWTRNPEINVTVIQGTTVSAPNDSVTISAQNITQPTTLSGFTIQGANAANEGNAIAVYIRNSNNQLQLRDNRVFAGNGGSGVVGGVGTAGLNGTNGSIGLVSIRSSSNSLTRSGGSRGTRTCSLPGLSNTNVRGGHGGDSTRPFVGVPNGGGQVALGPSPGSGGDGGASMLATATSCQLGTDSPPIDANPGTDGSPGTDGGGGLGASNPVGSVLAGRWRGANGAAGVHGGHGSGGGGGGAAAGVDAETQEGNWYYGASGGGGASGGCGGERGNGGTAGGASYGIFVHFDAVPPNNAAMPVIQNNSVTRGNGGVGGSGGNGGAGGDPGAGGDGGPRDTGIGPKGFCMFVGGAGGNGGRGGHGGGGGGGAGGASYDILVSNANGRNPGYGTNTFELGAGVATGGAGGAGGNSSNTAVGLGAAGVAGAHGTLGFLN